MEGETPTNQVASSRQVFPVDIDWFLDNEDDDGGHILNYSVLGFNIIICLFCCICGNNMGPTANGDNGIVL